MYYLNKAYCFAQCSRVVLELA